ncbi:DUF2931 family protein [Hymenobacter psoromatis]|uniref:DUF2931 family protein n=1 Tax=Hymenobacter psoromatis TaxID=1484116 RepID=UPI001CBC7FB9|nr:DUF2931 family protein [Hymenobacter psoromatis]
MQPLSSPEFKLSAAPCAAAGYPMEIHAGVFRGPGNKAFPVPSGHYLTGDWGDSAIHWALSDELQPAPETLDLLYFSYAEDRFYEGQFWLPHAQLQAWLQAGYWDTDENGHATYDELVVCVLPKGAVVLWLAGVGQQVLVGRYQAGQAMVDFRQLYGEADRLLMLQETRAELLPAVRQQLAAGTLSARPWDDYLVRYPWQLTFNQPLTLRNYTITYLSGESTAYPLTRDLVLYCQVLLGPEAKPMPLRWVLHVTDEAQHLYLLRVDPFDEAEMMAAFRALQQTSPTSPPTLEVETDKYLKKAALVLHHGGRRIPLTKSRVEILDGD